MALSGSPESMASQAATAYGNAFFCCIPATGSRRDRFFVLGVPPQGTAAQYVATPMVWYQRVPTFYLVRLLGIAVNGQLLNVTSSAFASDAVLDSRTTVTRLLQTGVPGAVQGVQGERKGSAAPPDPPTAAPPPPRLLGVTPLSRSRAGSSCWCFSFACVPA
jgi:hypothetical protein